jgi:Zn-finger nucleic acid-binding protein
VLPEGNYTASITASYFTPGRIAMKTLLTGKLRAVVLPPEKIPELKEMFKKDAEEAIKRAEDMINEARGVGADVTEEENLLTRAHEEFAKENYRNAKEYADAAYESALRKFNEMQKKAEKPLLSLEFGLLLLIFGSSVITAVLVYELYRILKKKKEIKKLPIAKGIKCPVCGKDMAVAYKGTLVVGYVCPKCKKVVVKEKTIAEK